MKVVPGPAFGLVQQGLVEFLVQRLQPVEDELGLPRRFGATVHVS